MSAAELNARQRKHVHMHSTIFSNGGPTTKSVYVPSRQELYEDLKGSLKEYTAQRPEVQLPTAGDMRCTQLAGHSGAVLPRDGQEVCATPRATRTLPGPETLVYDGESKPVVRAGAKDQTIPKEFWHTSVNLQWHDTRTEQCRQTGTSRDGMAAPEMKRQELSSEIFGKSRMTAASTDRPRQELMAETADHLLVDSQLYRAPNEAPQEGAAKYDPRMKFHQNLHNSSNNTLAGESALQLPAAEAQDDPASQQRRRQEKNFSDLFGTEMGQRKDIRGNRSEILGARNCSFLDSRSEIASRNQAHWKKTADTPLERKTAEATSAMFRPDRAAARPAADPEAEQVSISERACWENKDGMMIGNEITRRRVQKDYRRDFQDTEGHTHATRKQELMASSQVRQHLGASEAWAAPPSPTKQHTARGSPIPSERSAKDTKLASLQSSIFS